MLGEQLQQREIVLYANCSLWALMGSQGSHVLARCETPRHVYNQISVGAGMLQHACVVLHPGPTIPH